MSDGKDANLGEGGSGMTAMITGLAFLPSPNSVWLVELGRDILHGWAADCVLLWFPLFFC